MRRRRGPAWKVVEIPVGPRVDANAATGARNFPLATVETKRRRFDLWTVPYLWLFLQSARSSFDRAQSGGIAKIGEGFVTDGVRMSEVRVRARLFS
jgi:hypothetical protein